MRPKQGQRFDIILISIALLSAFLNIFNIWNNLYSNAYYTSAVTSMLQSWHNFFYASFDPGGYVTVDKPPVTFWVQTVFAYIAYSSSRSSDYPPLYMYILFLTGKIAGVPAMNPYFTLLLKLPSIVADITTSYLIYRLAGKYLSLEISVLLSAFYIFNPAVFINSTFWGQVDSFFTFIVVSAVFMLSEKKTGLSSALFAAAVMMKPQGIIFLPVLFPPGCMKDIYFLLSPCQF